MKPLELSESNVALGDVRPWEDLQLPVDLTATREEQAVQMSTQLASCLSRLDFAGSFANTVRRHWQHESKTFDFKAIEFEVREKFFSRLLPIANPSEHLRQTFRFREASGGSILTGDEAAQKVARLEVELGRLGSSIEVLSEEQIDKLHRLYFQVFHSLEKGQLDRLLRSLDTVISYSSRDTVEAMADSTISMQLREMFPALPSDASRLEHVHVELHDEEQRDCLLKSRFAELPALLSFLRSHLGAQDYSFAWVPLQLKQKLTRADAELLDELEASYSGDLPLHARELEAGLIEMDGYENVSLVCRIRPPSPNLLDSGANAMFCPAR